LPPTDRLTHVVPADQPQSVAEVAARLFPAYTVDEGHVSLAGCSLEDRLFLRLGFRDGDRTCEIFLNGEGQEVDEEPVRGLAECPPLGRAPQPLGPEIERLMAGGTRLAEEHLPGGAALELADSTAVWCKFADGKLRFTIGAAAVDLPFSGWARGLQAPPFVCQYTGESTYHLAATDDGRIVAAERIETCAETGRRLLSSELVTCSATGRRVAAELVEACPVSGRRLLQSTMVHCGTCRQRVSPAALERNQCLACRKLKRVSKADPRMARLFDEHPPLDRWPRWRIAETARVYVLVASGWLRRLLVVVDKESLELRLLATGSRLTAAWQVVEPAQYPHVLRE
jgi:hypothetical protein